MVGTGVPIVDSILNWNESILFETISEEHTIEGFRSFVPHYYRICYFRTHCQTSCLRWCVLWCIGSPRNNEVTCNKSTTLAKYMPLRQQIPIFEKSYKKHIFRVSYQPIWIYTWSPNQKRTKSNKYEHEELKSKQRQIEREIDASAWNTARIENCFYTNI